MTRSDIIISAANLKVSNYELLSGWSVDIGKIRRPGACFFDFKKILIGKSFIEKSRIIRCLNVIDHEIAHAVAYEMHGCIDHGIGFQIECVNMNIPFKIRY